MNSLYNPADSLVATLHFPYVNMNMETTCYFCNEPITFVTSLNRYVGNDGIRCSKVGG